MRCSEMAFGNFSISVRCVFVCIAWTALCAQRECTFTMHNKPCITGETMFMCLVVLAELIQLEVIGSRAKVFGDFLTIHIFSADLPG